ncbi:MAG: sodium/sugar symporter [Robiginitalea sp.]
MTSTFGFWDYFIFVSYALLILSVGLYVSRDKKGHQKTAEDYFLASKSLPWWAIGASLIAANISAEQFIGMSGSGFAVGLAIASYEWMAAVTLLIVGKFFLPIFINKGLYTIPEFVEQRYSTTLKTILAVFWTAVAWTDVIQVIFLVLGGLVTTYLALDAVSNGNGILAGLKTVYEAVPEKFVMILDKSNPEYKNLPGLGVLVGGLWVANLYYWGFNQYIIQRTLAAKSLRESQKGIILAAFLKIIIPVIVVIPGIAAYVMVNDPSTMDRLGDLALNNIPSLEQADKAYPWLLQFLPVGLKGVAFAALAAAIVSSLASMLNSTSTIFTMDIYRQYINPNASSKKTVNVGRMTAAVALVISCIMAPLLGGIDQAFQFIQEYTGLVSPGILAVFVLGLFWKKTTNRAAIVGALASIPIALYFKVGQNGWSDSPFFLDVPFLDQMGYTCLLTMGIIILVSLRQNNGADDPKGIPLTKDVFKTSPKFNIGAFAALIIISAIYALFWN